MSIEELVAAIQAGDQNLMEELWGVVVNLVKWKAKRVMTSLELLSDSRRGGSAMAISKAQQKAVNKYVRENCDRVNVNMPKGKKEKIQERAALCGMSVNAFINAAIDEKLNRDAEATE